MFKRIFVIATTVFLASTSVTTFARGGPGGGGHAGSMGGMSPEHISSQGMQNTNGPDASDRDKGLERAEDRMSQEGLTHEKAGAAHSKHKRHGSPMTKDGKDENSSQNRSK
ncbi:hypothetical protein [Rugosibacter aromaticivorans]|uniref:hypothetical protein n=1 Tax=Rugosibacter aromaticivorans TaxID=1565605 RepID=UPI00192A397C|nr:hypothetical protein [Rugosibacter aromaticivorans]